MQISLTVSDRVYRDMKSKIACGELSQGMRLVQRQLAAEYNTSSVPVIEALRRLERDGLVVSNAGFGAEVRTWTAKDMMGVAVLREILDGTVCRLFAENATSVERFELEELGREFDECVKAGDMTASIKADFALHLHIARRCGSPVLYQFAENSCIVSATMTNTIIPKEIAPVGGHNELIAAVNSGDPDRAELVGREHVRKGVEVPLKEVLRGNGHSI